MNIEKQVPPPEVSRQVLPLDVPKPSPYGTLSVFDFHTRVVADLAPIKTDGLVFRQIKPSEASLLQAAMEQAGVYEAGDVVRRLAAGREAFVGEVPGAHPHLATFGWLALDTEPLGKSGCAFEPPPGDAYLYDFATLPDYRRRGYYPALLRYILQVLAERSIGRAWIGTEPGNEISARSIARAGFFKVADTQYLPTEGDQPPHFELHALPNISADLLQAARQAHISCP